MPELQTTTLPLMPLTTGVILPGMVVTLTADTDEAKAAVAAAERGDGRLLLVPFIEGTYARTGTIGKIENAGDLPGGIRGLIIRGIERATVGAGVATGGTALLVQADPIAVPPSAPAPTSWLVSTGPSWRPSSTRRASATSTSTCGASPTPARWPTPPATPPSSPSSRRSRSWRPSTWSSAWRRCWPGCTTSWPTSP